MRLKMRFGDVLVIHDLSWFGRKKYENLKIIKLFIQQTGVLVQQGLISYTKQS